MFALLLEITFIQKLKIHQNTEIEFYWKCGVWLQIPFLKKYFRNETLLTGNFYLNDGYIDLL